MKQVSFRGRTAAAVAVIVVSAALTRVAGGGRKLAAALESTPTAAQSALCLRHGSAALQRHLKHNPRDILAAQLLNDVDTEIIRRT